MSLKNLINSLIMHVSTLEKKADELEKSDKQFNNARQHSGEALCNCIVCVSSCE